MTTLQIRRKGTVTLPASLRKKYKLEEGQILTLIDLGEGTILLTTKVSQVDKLADQIAEELSMKISLLMICYRHWMKYAKLTLETLVRKILACSLPELAEDKPNYPKTLSGEGQSFA